MSDQLNGRALDEAAAIAMGWTFITFPLGPCPEVKHWRKPGQSELHHWRSTPALSTDPATIPEMLDHLRAQDVHVEMHSCVDVRCIAESRALDRNLNRATMGTTLNEALARLVVEVARARGQK